MNRKERRKQAKLDRKNKSNNVVSLFPDKPKIEYLDLEETSEAIGFDFNNFEKTKISYQLDMYSDVPVEYCKDTDSFIIKDIDIACIVKTMQNVKEACYGYALVQLIRSKCEEVNSQRSFNVLASLVFLLTIRFDSNVVLNAVFEDPSVDKETLPTIIDFHDKAENMSEPEIKDLFESIPWNKDFMETA